MVIRAKMSERPISTCTSYTLRKDSYFDVDEIQCLKAVKH